MNKSFKNIVGFCLDSSSSMSSLAGQVKKVFNNQIEYLKKRSVELSQETRVSVWTFADKVENICFDVDVLRTPDISEFYNPYGNTALIDGSIETINDLKKIPQIHGEYGILIFCISDGMSNINNHRSSELSSILKDLPDNWTVAFLAPDGNAEYEAKRYGFHAGNISRWDVSSRGLDEASDVIKKATDNFMVNRAKGVRGTKNLFTVDTSSLDSKTIKNSLDELKPGKDYDIYPVHQDKDIKSFVESWSQQPYRLGSAYFELMKKETIQAYKQICIQDKKNGKVFSGDKARDLISLPNHEIKVQPSDYQSYRLFVQSTSSNRKLVKGTQLIVLK